MLNALRQSEENHRLDGHLGNLRSLVLNALRQSEENHLEWPEGYCLGGRCSTPYGNQRKITEPFDGIRVEVVEVLNALRQSEENHRPSPLPRAHDGATCSTPYGNQRKITAHPRILTLQGSDGAFASMYPYSIHQLPARRQVS